MTAARSRPALFRPYLAAGVLAAVGTLVVPIGHAHAVFHLAVLDEIMTSYSGDPSVQFVEIRMLSDGQGSVSGSVLSAFDDNGNFTGVIHTVTGNVSGGADRPWIMATSAWQTLSGITPDFVIPAAIPTSGMVCWGKPFDQTLPSNYVDCIAYSAYNGPTNVHIGTPTPLDGVGHSLRRVSETNDNLADFACADPADPTNNASQTFVMPTTVACSTVTTTSTTSTTTTTASTSTTLPVATGTCGDPVNPPQWFVSPAGTEDSRRGRAVTATDALLTLRTAVGAQICSLCVCDVNGSGKITSTDALIILQTAVGQPIVLNCPPCS